MRGEVERARREAMEAERARVIAFLDRGLEVLAGDAFRGPQAASFRWMLRGIHVRVATGESLSG